MSDKETSLSQTPENDRAANSFDGEILRNERVTAENHFQETRLIRFSFSGQHNPGDVLNVKPENPAEYVEMVFDAFPEWDRECTVEWEGKERIDGLNLPATLGDIVAKEVDLVGIPRRQFFAILGTRYYQLNCQKSSGLLLHMSLITFKGFSSIESFSSFPNRIYGPMPV